MPRHRTSKFYNGTKKKKKSASKERHPSTLPQFVKSHDKPDIVADLLRNSSRCCACGKMRSNTVHLQMKKTSNELFCSTYLNECNPSEMWCGIDDSTVPENGNEACDHATSEDIPFHTLGEHQTWEEVVGQWQKNMQLVPSKGVIKCIYAHLFVP
jgi:hypothetical protein